MPRPKRETVDWFPHHATHEVVSILDQEFGNDGYATWYKLQELLARSPGHYFVCRSSSEWRRMQLLMHLSKEKIIEIMEALIDFGLIDDGLWHASAVIWSQALVDSVAIVYQNNRKSKVPTKPVVEKGEVVLLGKTPINPGETPVLHVETPVSPSNTSVNVTEVVEREDIHNTPLTPQPEHEKSGTKNRRVSPRVDYDTEIPRLFNGFQESTRTAIKQWIAQVADINKTKTISQSKYASILGELSDVSATTTTAILNDAIYAAIRKRAEKVGYIKAIIKRKNTELSASGSETTGPPERVVTPGETQPPKPRAYFRGNDGLLYPSDKGYAVPGITEEEYHDIKRQETQSTIAPNVLNFTRQIMGALAS